MKQFIKFILTFILCCVTNLGLAVPSYDNGGSKSGTGTTVTFNAFTVTPGAAILVAVNTSTNSDLVTSITDSNGASYTRICQASNASLAENTVYKTENATGGSTTITIHLSISQSLNATAASYVGVPTSSVVDVVSACTVNASATTQTSPLITTTTPNELVVGVIGCQNCTSIAPLSGSTERQESTGLSQIEDISASIVGSYTTAWTLGATKSAVTVTLALKSSVSLPVLSATSLGAVTATSQTINYTNSDAVSTVHAVACRKGSTAPTVAEVLANTCHGATPDANISEASTGGSDSILLGGLGTLPVYDMYLASTNSAGNSSLVPFTSVCLADPVGRHIINCPTGLTGIASDSEIAALNGSIFPLIAVGDIPIADAVTTPENCVVVMNAIGHIDIKGPNWPTNLGSVCSLARQYINVTFYDTSVAAMHVDDLDLWVNNKPPSCPFSHTLVFFFHAGVSISPVDLGAYNSDPENDPLVITGTNLHGLTIDHTGGNNFMSGIISSRGIFTDPSFLTTDITGATCAW